MKVKYRQVSHQSPKGGEKTPCPSHTYYYYCLISNVNFNKLLKYKVTLYYFSCKTVVLISVNFAVTIDTSRSYLSCVFHGFWVFFLIKKKIYVSIQRVVCCLCQSHHLGYVSHTNQSIIFVLWFERCSNFNLPTHNLPQNTCVWCNWTFAFFSTLILFFPFVKM